MVVRVYQPEELEGGDYREYRALRLLAADLPSLFDEAAVADETQETVIESQGIAVEIGGRVLMPEGTSNPLEEYPYIGATAIVAKASSLDADVDNEAYVFRATSRPTRSLKVSDSDRYLWSEVDLIVSASQIVLAQREFLTDYVNEQRHLANTLSSGLREVQDVSVLALGAKTIRYVRDATATVITHTHEFGDPEKLERVVMDSDRFISKDDPRYDPNVGHDKTGLGVRGITSSIVTVTSIAMGDYRRAISI